MADDINKRRDLLQAELDIQGQLVKRVQTYKALSKEGLSIKQDMVTAMAEQASAAEKLETIDKAITDLLTEQVKRGDEVNQHYIEQLNRTKDILKLKQKEEIAENAQLKYLNTKKGILNSILGIDNEIEEAVMNGTFKALLLQKAFDNVSNTLGGMKDSMKSTMTELGVGVGEAAILQGNIEGAAWSFQGMLYGSDAMAASAREIAKEYGNVSAASSDMIVAVTEVATLTGDAASAAELVHVFEDAGVAAEDVKGVITDIANDAGISAQKVMEGMTGQMTQLVGKSESQLKTILKSNAALVKQGTSLSQIEDISNNMLDIESSMKSEAKARAFLGRDINASAVRSASLELQMARTEEERAAARAKISEEILKGVGGMEEFANMTMKEKQIAAEAYGMSADELGTMLQKKKVQDEMTAKYGEYAGFMEKAAGFGKQALSGLGSMGIELGKMVAQMMVMNLMQGKGLGLENLNPFKKKGGGGGSPIETEMPGTEEVGQTQSGGGLKSLAEGLREMGDGKVFAGIGAVALAGPAFIIALPSIPFLLFMGKVKLKALEENFSGLATGLNSMSTTFMGSLAMGAFGIAAIPSILSIPFLLFMGKVGLKNLASNFIQLGVGLQMMSSTFMGSLALAAFGVAALIAIPSLIFLGGIALLGAVGAAGLIALGSGLAALGGVAATGLPFLAIALIGALGIAMIPFAYALSLVTPLVEAFGNIIIGVFAAVPPIVQAVADGFVTMMGALTPESIGGLLLLGPALVMASIGMIAFSAAMLVGGLSSFFGGGIIDDITELAMIGPQLEMAGNGLASITTNLSGVTGVVETLADSLSKMGSVTAPLYGVAGGLFSISAGLSTLSFAGLMALPAIGGLMALAAVAPALESLGEFFGMGGSSESSESSESSTSSGTKELIDELKGLRSDIQSQPILINVDGKTVSRISRVQRQQASQKP